MITERIDNVTGLSKKYISPIFPPPISVKIEITGRCNFKCKFCAHSANLRTTGDMDRSFYSRIIREMIDYGVKELGVFYLGESFLCDWLPDAIREAKDVGFEYVFLTTNGSLATKRRVKECVDAGLDSLKFSFNYSDKQQLSNIAGVSDGYFDRIIENIKGAHEVKGNCKIYASYIQYDGEQESAMEVAVNKIRPYVDEVYALPLYNQAALVKNEWDSIQGNRGRSGNIRPPLPCWAVFTEGHITYDGKLSACCFDHDGRFDMADLNDTCFADAWNSDKFVNLRLAHISKNVKGTPCEQCVALQ